LRRGLGDQTLIQFRTALWLENTLRRSWIEAELACRTPWPRDELTAAVWADAIQTPLGACGAERALERANSRFGRLWREVSVAAFAIGPEFKHVSIPALFGRQFGHLHSNPVQACVIEFRDASGAGFGVMQLLFRCRVFPYRTREKGMNTHFVRANSIVMDGWPVLVACAVYAMAFYIFAVTMSSVFLVA